MKDMCRKKLGIFVAVLMVCALCMPVGYAGAAEKNSFYVTGNLQFASATKAKLSAIKATVVIGSTLTLTVKNLDESQVSAIKWKSNRTSIAKVNQKGVVTPVKVGTTTIKCTITYKDKTKQTLSCTITVKKRVKATAIAINNAEKVASLKVGERVTLKATLSPANTTDQIYWFSSNKAVATVGLTTGKVTAKKEGTVVMTARVGLDKKGATAKINKIITEIKIEIKSKDEPLKDTDESFFTWEKNENGITITGYKKDLPKNVVIPEKINGTTVAEIGYAAFANCGNLNSVAIPKSVTKISTSAFRRCSDLKEITIPNSVTNIGTYAFSGCSGLKSITIPNNVTSIDNYTFSDCNGLKNITIPNNVTSIGNSAFNGCSGLTSITIPNSVTSIGHSAFSDCSGLTNITIPDNVTSIGYYAFSGCSELTSIAIPNSITSIGYAAFSYCSGLKKIQVEKGNKIYDSRENSNAIIETKSNCLIRGCENTIIPNSVTSIDNYAFSGCSGLKSIIIPNSVTSIGDSAFDGCSGLKNLTIPNSVTSIGKSAFWGCSELKSITIPNGVISIDNYTFHGCSELKSITIPNGMTSISNYAFEYCSELTSIIIQGSVTTIDKSAFWGCSELKIHGKKDSYAQEYAEENNIPFVEE